MPFFQYEIRYSDGNDCRVYDAIFWAPTVERAEDHIFMSVRFRADMDVADCLAAYGVEPTVNEPAERVIEFTLSEQPDADQDSALEGAETTYSWLVGEPVVHEIRPEHIYYHSRWLICDASEPPTQPVRIVPANIRSAPGSGVVLVREAVANSGTLLTMVTFLQRTGNVWRPFTYAEYKLWCSVNDANTVVPSFLIEDGWLNLEVRDGESPDPVFAAHRDKNVFHFTDKLIHTLFAERGILAR